MRAKMEPFKARGIVLRETFAGESDKYVSLLLKGIGKLSVSARGARKPSSKFLAGTQPFVYSDFVIHDGGKFYAMSQIDIIESFYGLRDDYDKLCCGHYFLELCERVIIPGEDCDDVLLLLLKALSVIAKNKVAPALAAPVFELKFLQLCGYVADMTTCSECGRGITETVFFHADGCVCDDCRRVVVSIPLTPGMAQALHYISAAGVGEVFSFAAGKDIREGLKRASEMVFNAHIDVPIKSRVLIR